MTRLLGPRVAEHEDHPGLVEERMDAALQGRRWSRVRDCETCSVETAPSPQGENQPPDSASTHDAGGRSRLRSEPACQIRQVDWTEQPGKTVDDEEGSLSMYEKFRPGAIHDRLWPSLLVIGLIGFVGLALLDLLRL